MAAVVHGGPSSGVQTTVLGYRDAYAGLPLGVPLPRTKTTQTGPFPIVLQRTSITNAMQMVVLQPTGRPGVVGTVEAITVDREAFNKPGNGMVYTLTQPRTGGGGGGRTRTEGQLWPR